jgi:membrane-bound serine protease (ClpP class)
MKERTGLILIFAILFLFFTSLTSSQEQVKQVAWIYAHGMVDEGLFKSIQRRTREALTQRPALIVYEIDTYGGLLEPAFEIVDFLMGVGEVKTVAYVPRKAISAGALMALAPNQLVMGPHAKIGDCEPIIVTGEGIETAGEKIQSPIRTYMRDMARKNAYPIALAEAMVTKDMEVLEVVVEEEQETTVEEFSKLSEDEKKQVKTVHLETEEATTLYTPQEFDALPEEEKTGATSLKVTRTVKKYVDTRDFEHWSEEEKKAVKSRRVVVKEGELLTMNTAEARDYGFAKHTVRNSDELLAAYDLKYAEVRELEVSWSEQMVRFLEKIAPLLLIIGLIALYVEFKVPGFGLPGTVAIICFALLFLGKYMVGLAQHTSILIFLMGVVLLAIELFVIPGFGIVGATGIALIILGLFFAFQPYFIPRTPWQMRFTFTNVLLVGGALIGSLVGIAFLAKILPKVPVLGRIILAGPDASGVLTATATARVEEVALIGQEGEVLKILRPAGKAAFGERILDVVAEGGFIEAGARIKVVRVEGNRIIVRKI